MFLKKANVGVTNNTIDRLTGKRAVQAHELDAGGNGAKKKVRHGTNFSWNVLYVKCSRERKSGGKDGGGCYKVVAPA